MFPTVPKVKPKTPILMCFRQAKLSKSTRFSKISIACKVYLKKKLKKSMQIDLPNKAPLQLK